MRTLTSWMLAGALAASLTWNWTLYRRTQATCAESCALADAELGLDAAERAALEELCTRSCGEADRLEARADELQRELLDGLSAATVDEAAATRLVAEVSELRQRSLAACVQGVLGVRKVLGVEQVRTLLERCEHTRCK